MHGQDLDKNTQTDVLYLVFHFKRTVPKRIKTRLAKSSPKSPEVL